MDQPTLAPKAGFDYTQPFDGTNADHRAELDRICEHYIPEGLDAVEEFYLQGLAWVTPTPRRKRPR